MNTNKTTQNINALNRIKFVSKALKIICFFGLIVQGMGILGVMIGASVAAAVGKLEPQVTLQNCCALATLPLGLIVTMYFYHFFNRLKDGHLFDLQTVKYLEAAGKWWILLAIARILVGAVVVHVYSLQDVSVSGDGIGAGLIICFVAWVLREAQKLQEEQELTV